MTKVTKNWLEWSVFAVGLVLIMLLLGYLIYDAATLKSRPPIIQVEIGAVQPQDGRYLVPVTLRNAGDQTAQEVMVEFLLKNGEEEVETSELAVDFLPRQSSREGWVTFQTDPRSVDSMESHVLGYQIP